MPVILFTMRDVEQIYFDKYDDALASAPKGPGVKPRLDIVPAKAPTASAMAKNASQSATTYVRRTARGALISVKKGLRNTRRALAKNKIAQSVDRAAGSLIADTGKAVSEAGSHIGRNKGKYALGAAALGAAGAGAYYLMNRRERDASYSRYPRTVYFSRR